MSKKKKFLRTDVHKKKKLKKSWRKPKGLQNKRRLSKRGYGINVDTGYSQSKDTKGKTSEGLEPVRTSNMKELEALDSKSQGAIISSNMGDKNRLPILEAAKKKNIKVLNLNIDKKIKEIKESLEKRKQDKEEAEKKKKKEEEKKKKEAEKKAKEKKEKEEKDKKLAKEDKNKEAKESSEEDDKDEKKKELDKVLTKKK